MDHPKMVLKKKCLDGIETKIVFKTKIKKNIRFKSFLFCMPGRYFFLAVERNRSVFSRFLEKNVFYLSVIEKSGQIPPLRDFSVNVHPKGF
jgi:hypothetical protein